MKPLVAAWRGIGFWRWPSLMLLAACLVLTPFAGPIQPRWITHEPETMISADLQLETRGRLLSGNAVQIRITGMEGVIDLYANNLLAVRGVKLPTEVTLVVPDPALTSISIRHRELSVRYSVGHDWPVN